MKFPYSPCSAAGQRPTFVAENPDPRISRAPKRIRRSRRLLRARGPWKRPMDENPHRRWFDRPTLLLLVASLLIGGGVFWVRFGPEVLSPTSIGWLFAKDDSSGHYLGWLFYRDEAWTLPLGAPRRLPVLRGVAPPRGRGLRHACRRSRLSLPLGRGALPLHGLNRDASASIAWEEVLGDVVAV